MPNIIVKIPKGSLSPSQLDDVVAGITEAARKAEGIPDTPEKRALIWVMVDELEPGRIYAGGKQAQPAVIPVVVQIYPPEGVLDQSRREGLASDIADVVRASFGEDVNKLMVSCMMLDVPDATWGINGQLWSLPHFARAAGYQHLQSIT
ncbi:tautomerase family protein [Sphingorhabdus sp. EL138]|uniref:tautomerase family protein n=1 Tax=Sphingorhabdus sp. EL138 TaxID=2073156 RepID=UPI000D68B8A0|nr:tautomerase family protein [Sphingorhabdus sp. EL138]